MIRKLLFLFISAVIISCNNEPGFILNGFFSGAGEGFVYLSGEECDGTKIIDSVRMDKGSFRFKGRLETPEPFILSIDGHKERKLLFIGNGIVSVTGSADSIHLALVEGSVTDNEYSEYEMILRQAGGSIITLFDKYHDALYSRDNFVLESVAAERIRLESEIISSAIKFVRQHPGSFASPYILLSLQADLPADSLDLIADTLDPMVRTSLQYRMLKECIDRMHSLEPGMPAPDFTQNTHAGDTFTLSGNFGDAPLLIYFWASWCSSCADATKETARLNELYKGIGLKIISVSLDFSFADWEEAIKRDRMEWINITDLKLWDNRVVREYNVTEIPFFYLIDSDGTIITSGKSPITARNYLPPGK